VGSQKFDPALDDHLRAIAYKNGRGAMLVPAALTAAWWPADLIVFRHFPDGLHAAAWMRVAVIGAALGAWLLLRTKLGPRWPMLIMSTAGALVLFAVGWGFGSLGGAERPWIHLSYPALFLTVPAPVGRRRRALLVSALAASLAAGFLAPFPAHLRDPLLGLVLATITSMALLAFAVGTLSFRLFVQSFKQQQALTRASGELAALNGTLESRVEAQTRDLRRLTDHLERAREEERAHIARELHDELGQELTALGLALTLTRQRFARDPQCIAKNLDEIDALVSRTQASTRHLLTELRPRLLDELGLEPAIEWLVKQAERAGLRCRLEAGDLSALSPAHRTVAFRVVQEALTNVVRHAAAREVDVIVDVRAGELRVRVTDDGVGLPEAHATKGFGLMGIRERVTTLAGRLELSARPGGGTTLSVTLPVCDSAKAEGASA
jgi:signal transduction histidine kinase